MKTSVLIKLYLDLIDKYIRLKELKIQGTKTMDTISNRIQALDKYLFNPKIEKLSPTSSKEGK